MKLIKNESGVLNVLLVPLILASVLLVASIGFGAWAFTSREDYKSNVDEKIAAAIEVNTKQVSDEKDNEFLEKEKFPLFNFQGTDQLGSIKVSYPKTWSAYISEEEDTATYIFNPKLVNANEEVQNALRIVVESQSYSDTVSNYDSEIEGGGLTAKAFSLPRVQNVVGLRLDGTFSDGKQGSVVILPLRDKTISIFNEVPSLEKDYTDIVLKNLTFVP